MERGKKTSLTTFICFSTQFTSVPSFLEAELYTGCVASWAQVDILSHFSRKSSESVYIIFQGLWELLNHKRWWSAAGGIKASGPDLSSQAQTQFVWFFVCLWPCIWKYSSAALLCICISAVCVLGIIFLCKYECCISVCEKYSTCLHVLLAFKVFWKSLFILIECISTQDPSLCTF